MTILWICIPLDCISNYRHGTTQWPLYVWNGCLAMEQWELLITQEYTLKSCQIMTHQWYSSLLCYKSGYVPLNTKQKQREMDSILWNDFIYTICEGCYINDRNKIWLMQRTWENFSFQSQCIIQTTWLLFLSIWILTFINTVNWLHQHQQRHLHLYSIIHCTS
jgi:hypothetical protein